MDASALHPSKSTQDLIQASRPGFPQGLRVRSLARFRPRRRVRRAKTGSPRSRFHGFPGSYPIAHAKTRTHPNLAPTLTLAAPTMQVLYVMKDTALHAPAKKLLEDIGYKGASWRHRAPDPALTVFPDYHAWKTRSPRPSGRFSPSGWVLRARHRAATEPRDGIPPRGPKGTHRVSTRALRAVAGVPAATHAVALSLRMDPPPIVSRPYRVWFRPLGSSGTSGRNEVVSIFFHGALALLLTRVLPPSSHSLPPPSRPQLPPPRPSIRVSASSSPPPPTRRRRLTSRSSRGNRRSRSSTRRRPPPPPPP